MKSILLTFDLEEFDLPKEYYLNITEKEMYEISLEGLNNLLNILNRNKIKATFFTTANFAIKYPEIIKELSKKHEIASHGYSHSMPLTLENIKNAKEVKENIIKKEIKGFRAPRWDLRNLNIVSSSEFKYDSSTHPIYLPGRYNNLSQKRNIQKKNNLIEIPASTIFPNFSIFWLTFKNFPLIYSKIFTKINFLNSRYTMLVQHPWEFADIENIKIPKYIKNPCGKKLTKKLEDYIQFCKSNNYKFQTVEEFLGDYFKINFNNNSER